MANLLKQRFGAGYTVEASLLISSAIMIILLVIYSAFYFHDRLILSLNLRETVRWAGAKVEQGMTITGAELEQEAKLRQGYLLCIRTIKYSGSYQEGKITLAYQGNILSPFRKLWEILAQKDYGIVSFEIEEKVWKPEQKIRMFRMFSQVGE